MMHIVNNMMEFLILYLFSIIKFHIKYRRNRQSNQSKVKKHHIHLIFGMTAHTML